MFQLLWCKDDKYTQINHVLFFIGIAIVLGFVVILGVLWGFAFWKRQKGPQRVSSQDEMEMESILHSTTLL